MSTATNGRRREWKVRDQLRSDGYLVVRVAGSKGAADLHAYKPGQILFVQVKPNALPLSPADRARLLEWASYARAVPLVAFKGTARGEGIIYRRLTGPGPTDWQPWTPDQVGTP